jgi:hypothetical protein
MKEAIKNLNNAIPPAEYDVELVLIATKAEDHRIKLNINASKPFILVALTIKRLFNQILIF